MLKISSDVQDEDNSSHPKQQFSFLNNKHTWDKR